MKPAPKPRLDSVSRHWIFAAVRSGARTAQIGRAAVIFLKTPSIFWKSTRAPETLSVYFAKNISDYFEINPQSRSDGPPPRGHPSVARLPPRRSLPRAPWRVPSPSHFFATRKSSSLRISRASPLPGGEAAPPLFSIAIRASPRLFPCGTACQISARSSPTTWCRVERATRATPRACSRKRSGVGRK